MILAHLESPLIDEVKVVVPEYASYVRPTNQNRFLAHLFVNWQTMFVYIDEDSDVLITECASEMV